MRRDQFTLIELLVVIAIIAILAALLLPSLATARDRAKGTLCIGNQRQCMLGSISYASDFGGFTPPADAICSTPYISVTRNWYVTLLYNNYVSNNCVIYYDPASFKNYAVLRYPNVISCPAFSPVNDAANPSYNTCYSPRWFGFPSTETWTAWGASSLWKLTPSMPYIADTIVLSNPIRSGGYWSTSAFINNVAVNLLHLKSAGVAYPDGHAALANASKLAASGVTAVYSH